MKNVTEIAKLSLRLGGEMDWDDLKNSYPELDFLFKELSRLQDIEHEYDSAKNTWMRG